MRRRALVPAKLAVAIALWLAGVCGLGNAVSAFEIEARRITMGNTFDAPVFTQVTFAEPFDKVPVVVIRTSQQGGDRAIIRIRNVTRTGFEAVIAESSLQDGPHVNQNVDYIAMEEGVHVLPGGETVAAGFHDTTTAQNNFGGGAPSGWDTINLPATLDSAAAVLAHVQTMNNEYRPANLSSSWSNGPPRDGSVPFLAVAIDRLPTASSFRVALERNSLNRGTVEVSERIGYIAFPSNRTGTLTANNGATISWSAVRSAETIRGFRDGCFNVSHGLNSSTVRAVPQKITRDDADGGWVRSCRLTNTQIGLGVDDEGNRRRGDREIAAVIAFSDDFHAGFDFGDAPDTGAGTGPGDYQTSLTDDGPRHAGGYASTVWLGGSAGDTDDGTRASTLADGDDQENAKPGDPQNTPDDEDGVIVPDRVVAGGAYQFRVNVRGTGFLSAWVDWNGDGDFSDAGEALSDNRAVSSGQLVLAGTAPQTLTSLGATYARFRICGASGDCAVPTGRAADGEVEDHRVLLRASIRLAGRIFRDNGTGGATAHDGVMAGGETGMGAVAVNVTDVANGTVYAAVATAADGTFEAVLPETAAGRALNVGYAVPTGHIAVSEAGSGLPGYANSAQDDAAFRFTPAAGTAYTGADFGVIAAPALRKDGKAVLAPGTATTISHVYTSTTTASVTFSLTDRTQNQSGAFTTTVFRDADCDGALSQGEPVLAAPVVSSAGADICVLVRSHAASGAVNGARIAYRLTAQSVLTVPADGGATRSLTVANTDVVEINSRSAELLKTVQNITQNGPVGTSNSGAAGDTLEYVLTLTNPSSGDLTNVELIDRTPAYTALAQSVALPVVSGSSVSCSLISPSGSANAAGYEGVVQWRCNGALGPAARIVARYRVRIAP